MTDMMTVRAFGVIVADDDRFVCEALRELIGDDPLFEVRGVAHSGLDAACLASEIQVDLAIVDVQMPQGGLEAIRAIKECSPDTKVVVFTAKTGNRLRHELIGAGASAVLYKGSESDITGALARIVASSV